MVAGCNGAGHQAPVISRTAAANAHTPAVRQPSIAEQTVGMVEAATIGKANAPVGLKFELLRRPAVAEPCAIDIALVARGPADSAVVQVADSPGLSIAAADRQFVVPAPAVGKVYRHTLTVTPSAAGISYLGLTVQLRHDSGSDTRSFAVPIIVGGDAAGVRPSAATATPAAAMATPAGATATPK